MRDKATVDYRPTCLNSLTAHMRKKRVVNNVPEYSDFILLYLFRCPLVTGGSYVWKRDLTKFNVQGAGSRRQVLRSRCLSDLTPSERPRV